MLNVVKKEVDRWQRSGQESKTKFKQVGRARACGYVRVCACVRVGRLAPCILATC